MLYPRVSSRRLFALSSLTAVGGGSAQGRFKADQESLKQYRCPEWFRDAKFGIWSHWGPQCVPEDGDWYARRLYMSANTKPNYGLPNYVAGSKPNRGYTLHSKAYGHPSRVGFKDIIPLWKAEKWNPDELMELYARAGAKYFVSMAVHHDNFDLWNSKHQPRWNAVATGPQRDVVGDWQKAAKKRGLWFGVSEHLGASFTWYQVNKGADPSGPMAGVPYDGNDPQYQDLYHPKTEVDDNAWLTTNPRFHATWLARIRDLVDTYNPDLLYSDSKFPFGAVGAELVSHFYNNNEARNGTLTAIYNCKEDPQPRGWIRDIERGVMTEINPEPWQTDTSIGDWYYRKGEAYKTSTQILQMLADIVSKNGNLLINVVQKPDGEIPDEARQVLEEIAAWMQLNGEAIFATRPWQVYGEGPSVTHSAEPGEFGGAVDVRKEPYTAEDIRYTQSKDGKAVFALVMGRANAKVTLHAARVGGKRDESRVELLATGQALHHHVDADGVITISIPDLLAEEPSALKLSGFELTARRQ